LGLQISHVSCGYIYDHGKRFKQESEKSKINRELRIRATQLSFKQRISPKASLIMGSSASSSAASARGEKAYLREKK
jgi:hypothetical protein